MRFKFFSIKFVGDLVVGDVQALLSDCLVETLVGLDV